jgi:hypothetical protein
MRAPEREDPGMSIGRFRLFFAVVLLTLTGSVAGEECSLAWQNFLSAELGLRNGEAARAEIEAADERGEVVHPAWRKSVAWHLEYIELLRDLHSGAGSERSARIRQLLRDAGSERSDRARPVAKLFSVAARLPAGTISVPIETLRSWTVSLEEEVDALRADPPIEVGRPLPGSLALTLEHGIAHAALLSGDTGMLANAQGRLLTLRRQMGRGDSPSAMAEVDYLLASVSRSIAMAKSSREELRASLERFELAARSDLPECSASLIVNALLGVARTRLDLAAYLPEGVERSDLVLGAVSAVKEARRIADPVVAPQEWRRVMRLSSEVYAEAAGTTRSRYVVERFRWLSERTRELGL